MDRNKQLSGSELAELAEQMINAPTEAEKDALREKLIRGILWWGTAQTSAAR